MTLISVGGGIVLQEPLNAAPAPGATVPGSATSFSASSSGSQCSLNFSISDGGDAITNYSYSFDNSTFFVGVPNEFNKEWLQTRFNEMILTIIQKHDSSIEEIKYIVKKNIGLNDD